ncbi:hypothetical protein LDENG_00246640, partial [Lucifuga dentata]
VYFDCGAKVDVVDVQGLILSPGFPYNYSSGTHCVWQFFVPADYQLILEIFDFDVFESHASTAQYYSAISDFEEEEAGKQVTLTPGSLAADETSSEAKDFSCQSEGDIAKTQQSSRDGEVKQVVVQEESTKMEITRGDLTPSSNLAMAEEEETTFPSLHPTDTPAVSPETQQSVLDACPHDVLYISDLITFSSRFCGSQLVFGSNQEMVEVIMELITTTHWGRGFALLFHYHNLTEPGGDRRVSAPAAGRVDSLLAAVSGAAFFAMILTSALCIIFR